MNSDGRVPLVDPLGMWDPKQMRAGKVARISEAELHKRFTAWAKLYARLEVRTT